MVTNRKKLRNRKQLYFKIIFIVAVLSATSVVAYFIALKVFEKPLYTSPLAKVASDDFSHKTDKEIDFIKERLANEKIEVVSIKHQDARYIIILKDNAEVILSSEKDINSQISSLQFILSRLTMEGKLFTQLDLRFDKPVITLQK